MYCCNYLNNS